MRAVGNLRSGSLGKSGKRQILKDRCVCLFQIKYKKMVLDRGRKDSDDEHKEKSTENLSLHYTTYTLYSRYQLDRLYTNMSLYSFTGLFSLGIYFYLFLLLLFVWWNHHYLSRSHYESKSIIFLLVYVHGM